MTLLWMIILLMMFQPSYQKNYVCDPNVECGCSRKPAFVARIVNGEDANEGTWNWAVSIVIKSTNQFCGGSILSNSWIITAAHCVRRIEPTVILVYAGSNMLGSGSQNRTVSEIIVHPGFKLGTFVNDIALLKLTSPLNMDDSAVSTICIPSVSSKTLETGEWPEPKTSVVAVGWGRIIEDGPESNTLQQVALRTIDYQASTCSALITDKRVQFCAGINDSTKDTCDGDSGGPLMMFTSTKQWVLVGLTSAGHGCARKGYSGIYTRVAAFQQWIDLNTNGSYSRIINMKSSEIDIINSSANMIASLHFSTLLYAFLFIFFLFF